MDRGARGHLVRRRAGVVGALAGPLVLLPALPAGAASTGWKYERSLTFNDGISANVCQSNEVELGAGVNAGDVVGETDSAVWNYNSSGGCVGNIDVATGYIIAWVDLYRNGSLCNSASQQLTSSGYETIAYTACENPSGSQYYDTVGWSGWFKGQYCTANDNCVNGFTITENEIIERSF